MLEINQDFRDFVERHSQEDPARLKLHFSGKDPGFDMDFALLQIECRRKGRGKLDRFLSHPDFLFADRLSAEQSSDLAVAGFHRTLAAGTETVVDLTAGLGADALSIAGDCRRVTAIELVPLKAEVLRHNASVLGLERVDVVCADCMEWLRGFRERADLMFIDPARRDGAGKRTYAFRDCAPDIASNLPLVMERCRRLLVKASPLLDVSKASEELGRVSRVFAVSHRGECKELLFELLPEGNGEEETTFTAVDILTDGTVRTLSQRGSRSRSEVLYAGDDAVKAERMAGGLYLYEPGATVMKLALWGELCRRYPDIRKMAPNTHLFLSETLYPDFPGRRMRVTAVPTGKELKRMGGRRMTVVSRNYPATAAEMRKKLKLAEGDREFLYCLRLGEKAMTLLCEPV